MEGKVFANWDRHSSVEAASLFEDLTTIKPRCATGTPDTSPKTGEAAVTQVLEPLIMLGIVLGP